MTAQNPDKIIYKGQEYAMHTNPMEDYFNEYPDKQPQSDIQCTGLWRGYIATCVIENDQLFLKNISIMIPGEHERWRYTWKNVMDEVFPSQELVKLDWYTGALVLPLGEIIKHVHMGYLSTYEHYTLLEIKDGNLINEKHLGHEEYEAFREKQYIQTIKTKPHIASLEDLIKKVSRSRRQRS